MSLCTESALVDRSLLGKCNMKKYLNAPFVDGFDISVILCRCLSASHDVIFPDKAINHIRPV